MPPTSSSPRCAPPSTAPEAGRPGVIKYLGSKRRLVPVLTRLCEAADARTALDLFTGTTRVAQAFKRTGAHVTAVDTARYAEVFARTYVATDARAVDLAALEAADRRPERASRARPATSPRRSASSRASSSRSTASASTPIRDAIEREHAGTPLYPILLTSLIEAADRVDSTTGVQMAYVKQWAPRSYLPLTLRVPELLPGAGVARARRRARGRAARCPRSTSPTSTRRTTSTGTSRTTTSGRRWSRGTRRSTTASRASASTLATTSRRACSTAAGDARRAARA